MKQNSDSTNTIPDQVRARLERRRSGAAGKHADRRTRRNRDRSTQRRNAVSDSSEEES